VTGIVLTALIGLSRVYLGVHYLSDVNAGWSLGAAAFSLMAAIALVISTLRHNAGDVAAAGASEDPK
jgi:undecaprenyl-diphosphatase